MIELKKYEQELSLYSYSYRIEFLFFYDKLMHLIYFYNISNKSFLGEIQEMKSSLNNFITTNSEDKIFTAEDDDLGILECSFYEVREGLEDQIFQKELYFKEIQLSNFIIHLYSEFEKLMDNLLEVIQYKKKMKVIDKLKYVCKISSYNGERLIEKVDNLRKMRNFIVHRYDYWEFNVPGFDKEIISSFDNLTDDYLSAEVELLLEYILDFEKKFQYVYDK